MNKTYATVHKVDFSPYRRVIAISDIHGDREGFDGVLDKLGFSEDDALVDIPTKYKYLEKYSGIMIDQVAMNDRSIYELFESTEPLGIPQMDRADRETKLLGLMVGTLGLPEFGTNFIQGVLVFLHCFPVHPPQRHRSHS